MTRADLAAPIYGASIIFTGALASAGLAARARERVIGSLVRRDEPTPQRGTFDMRRPLRALGVLTAAASGFLLTGPVGLGLGAIVWFWVMRARARARVRRRAELGETQMAELVGALAAATRAGRSFRGAIEEAETDLRPPLAEAVAAVRRGLAVGESTQHALGPLASFSADGRLLVALVAMHARTGGDLPRSLDELGSIVVRRVEARRQARALSAQARASGAVLASLPIAFVGLLSGVSVGGLGDLYRTPVGALLLCSGLGLDWLGFNWLRRIGAAGEKS